MAENVRSLGIWDAKDCAVMFIDYQEHVIENVFEQDRRVVELNACTLAKTARAFGIPAILSTVGVKMGVGKPTVAALRAALPGVEDIDRSTMDAWEDPAFRAAVDATGRKRLIMVGLVTSVCLAYPVVHALAEGYDVAIVVDAVADTYLELHNTAVLRMAHAGAVPLTTVAIMMEWFRDWKGPLAPAARDILVPYLGEVAALKRAPELHQPQGVMVAQH